MLLEIPKTLIILAGKGIVICPQYFTNWILSFYMINFYLDFPKDFLLSLLLLVNLGSVGGFYITYITPQKLYVPLLDFTIEGTLLKFIDVFAHHLPAIHVNYLVLSNTYFLPKLPSSDIFYIMALIYFLLNDPHKRYDLTYFQIFQIFLVTLTYTLIVLNFVI